MIRLRFFSQTHLRGFMAHERIFMLLAACAIGVAGGFAAIGFRFFIKVFGELFGNFGEWSAQLTGWSWLGVMLAPAVGGLIVGPVIYRFAREARGHGVPEVMAAVMRNGGFIRPRVVAIKTFASAITIGSGGSVGREGPIIQIGSSIGSLLGYLLHVPPRLMRTFVACGAAAGIAATFNAPIAGTLFAVEIILGDFGFTQLAPIVTSSVLATVISRSVEGDFASFDVPSYALLNPKSPKIISAAPDAHIRGLWRRRRHRSHIQRTDCRHPVRGGDNFRGFRIYPAGTHRDQLGPCHSYFPECGRRFRLL